ncbi:MAG: T9SS type A sorting domain-containing protein [Bacteroidetes bacterium]|nr:T9SS type A sorting domain-containing protein [Bacteroidota bacterium]
MAYIYPKIKFSFLIIYYLISLTIYSQDQIDGKIAQMLMVGFVPNTVFEDTLYYDIQYRNLGGVINFAYNITSPSQIKNQSNHMQNIAPVPLLIATDQEGGIVARLDEQNGFAKTYTAFDLGTKYNNEATTRTQSALMAGWMIESGLNTNFGPVADVNVNPTSPAIGKYGRSFSSDPNTVYLHSKWFADEFKNKNINTALKHFPGHGSAKSDSHNGFTDITNTWTDAELIPYKNLIENGYNNFIMTGHLFNANLDPDYPASLSRRIITHLLRDSLNFKGLVISDEMFMNAISDNYGFDESIELAINAGTDILLFKKNEYNNISLVKYVVELVKRKITEGKIPQSRIDESYERIQNLKNSITSIKNTQSDIIPEFLTLSSYPNPFNNSANIIFTLKQGSGVKLKIYDITGQAVYKKYYESLTAGEHRITFNAAGLSSGTYIAVIETPGHFKSVKLTLIK